MLRSAAPRTRASRPRATRAPNESGRDRARWPSDAVATVVEIATRGKLVVGEPVLRAGDADRARPARPRRRAARATSPSCARAAGARGSSACSGARTTSRPCSRACSTTSARAPDSSRTTLPEPSLEGRVDLRDLVSFTIDPDTAKDFDDAISVRREGDGLRAWVHIADVSHFVPAGTPLDRGAAERAFSTYVPGRVAPMLPPELVGRRVQPAPARRPPVRHRRGPVRRRARGGRADLLPLGDPQPRALHLRAGGAHPRGPRAAPAPSSERSSRSPSGSRPSCGGGGSRAARCGSRRARSCSRSTAAAASSARGARASRTRTRWSRS